MWRAFTLLLIANPTRLSRSMESFRPQPAKFCTKYDASLTGLGVGLYRTIESSLVAYTALDIPFNVTNESKRQNTMEFLAVILGLLLAWRSNVLHFHYQLHGDSISSLAWTKADRVNSTLACRENIVFTTISIHLDATVADTVHVPGTLSVPGMFIITRHVTLRTRLRPNLVLQYCDGCWHHSTHHVMRSFMWTP